MRICFYAALKDPRLFDLVEFYRQDIDCLRALGHSVRLARRPLELPGRDDLYWVWWQTSGTPAVLTAGVRREPCVLVTALSDRDPSPSGMAAKPPWSHAAARISLRMADLVLATSNETRRGLRGYRTRRLETAYLAVDTDRYRPGQGEAAAPYALTISHLTADNVERKRILDVVRVAALTRATLPDLRFRIVGEHGSGAEAVVREVERLGVGDRVELPGRVSPDEKVRLLQAAMVYLQPTSYEAFGLALAEAMACGKPVIAHAVGSVPEVVGDAGRLLEPGAATGALARALEDLRDAAARAALGREARARVVVRPRAR